MAQALQGHLSRWLLGYALAVMGAGVAVGQLSLHWTASHRDLVSTLTTVAVFFMIYPMMVNLRVEALARAGRNARGLLLAVGYNFVWAPLLGYGLAQLFLHDPMLALGFLLVMVVPCSSMSIAYTGLAGGDVELATVSSGRVSCSRWRRCRCGWCVRRAVRVPIPLHDMLTSIRWCSSLPWSPGWLTRHAVTRARGAAALKRLQPAFPAASLLAMFAIIFLIFFAKAGMIVAKWPTVLLLLVPNALFIAVTLALATWLDRRLGCPTPSTWRWCSPPPVRTTAPRSRSRRRRSPRWSHPGRDDADLPGDAAGRLPQARRPGAHPLHRAPQAPIPAPVWHLGDGPGPRCRPPLFNRRPSSRRPHPMPPHRYTDPTAKGRCHHDHPSHGRDTLARATAP